MKSYTTKDKKELIKNFSPKTHFIKNGFLAFLAGGFICALGESLYLILKYFDVNSEDARIWVAISLIAFASLLTGIGVFDNLCRVFGAGFLLPITGFSNGITSEAIDSRNEGYILGVGSKIFTVAGPVILYGIFSGVIYGIAYYIYLMFA